MKTVEKIDFEHGAPPGGKFIAKQNISLKKPPWTIVKFTSMAHGTSVDTTKMISIAQLSEEKFQGFPSS